MARNADDFFSGELEVGDVFISYANGRANQEFLKLDGAYYYNDDYSELAAMVSARSNKMPALWFPFANGDDCVCGYEGLNIHTMTESGDYFRSTDMGRSWSQKLLNIYDETGLLNTDWIVKRLIADEESVNKTVVVLLQSTSEVLFRVCYSFDNGATWNIGDSHNKASSPITTICISNGVILAHAHQGDAVVYRSADSGQTWSEINLPTTSPYYVHQIDIRNNLAATASSNRSQICYSTDAGVTWSLKSSVSVSNLSIGPAGEIVAVDWSDADLTISTDNGVTWTSVAGTSSYDRSRDVCVGDDGHIYLAMYNTSSNPGYAFVRVLDSAENPVPIASHPYEYLTNNWSEKLLYSFDGDIFLLDKEVSQRYSIYSDDEDVFRLDALPVNVDGDGNPIQSDIETTYYKVRAK